MYIKMIKDIIVAFLVVMAIFFGIMPHRVHCDIFRHVSATCPSHWIFILNGIIIFALAILFSQWTYVITGVTKLCSN